MPKLTTQYIDLPTIKLAYTEAGSGQPLLFLHGNSESKRIFRHYQSTLFTDYHTYALDSRGHGQSVSNDESLSIEQLNQDVIVFCKAKGIQAAGVVGYSDGGNIALFLANRAPHLFSRVIAISPNTLVDATEPRDLKNMYHIHRLMKRLERIGLPMKKRIMVWELMLKDIGFSEEDLRAIQTGMLILYAEQEMIKISHIHWIASQIPNATTEMIPACTHMNILQQPRTAEVIRQYLSQ